MNPYPAPGYSSNQATPQSAEQQARGMDFVSGPGQPRLQLWQFLIEILNKAEFSSIIRWTGVEPGEFKVIETEEVARLWGLRKGRPNMNYDKLSRSLRYYYDKGILEKVPGQRLVYKFDSDLKRRQEQFACLPRTPSEVTTPTTPLTPMMPMQVGGNIYSIGDSRFQVIPLTPPPAKKPKLSHQTVTLQDIEARSPEAAALYESALAEGKKRVRKTRLFLFGPPRSGKTSLKRALLGQSFNQLEESTMAVDCSVNACVMEPGQKTPWKTRDQRAFKTREFEKEVGKYVARGLRKKRQESAAASAAGEPSKEEITIGAQAMSVLPETIIPDDIVTRIATSLRSQDSSAVRYDSDKSTVINIWDLGGQALHRVLQTALVTSKAIYVLVVDLSKDFNGAAPSHFVQGNQDIVLDENKGETYLDQILESAGSIYAAAAATDDGDPTILVVGTRKDQLVGRNIDDVVEKKFVALTAAFQEKPYQKCVIHPFIAVNLRAGATGSDDLSLEDLRVQINETARSKFAMEIPLRWLKFDKTMDALRRQNLFYVALDDVTRIAREDCGVSDAEEIAAMLAYYHDQGLLLHYRRCVQLGDVVITKPQWLIGALKRLLEVQLSSGSGGDGDSGPYHDSWQRLHAEGVLEEGLIEHVWSDYARNKQLLLTIMDQLDLVSPRLQRDGGAPTAYYMPAMLHIKPNHEEFCESLSSERDSEVLAFRFRNAHVPLDFFSRLLVRCLQLCPFHPGLFRTCARFEFDSDHDLVLLACRDHIKFVVQSTQYGERACLPSAAVCMEILRFLTATVNELHRQWMPGLEFDLAARYPGSTAAEDKWIRLPVENMDWIAEKKIPDAEGGNPIVPGNTLLLWFENSAESVKSSLPESTLTNLVQLLDQAQDGGKTWRLLATYLGFVHGEIRELAQADSPPLAILEAWEKRESSSLERLKEKVKLLDSDELYECL
eukprot:m.43584 g.43584  ORF g.43584 m.43584 type:complete len:949 (+) comp33455_c0_seq1:137-2983(+)